MSVQKDPTTVTHKQHVQTILDPIVAVVTQAMRVMDKHALVRSHLSYLNAFHQIFNIHCSLEYVGLSYIYFLSLLFWKIVIFISVVVDIYGQILMIIRASCCDFRYQ